MPSRTTIRRRRFALAGSALLLVTALAVPAALTVFGGAPILPALAGGGSSGGSADGEIATGDRVSVDDIHVPALANLDAALLEAVQLAADAAAADGVTEFFVTSGWRSPEYQQRLFDQAVRDYGSEQEAARWAARPETSLHVSGDAIDIGPFDATYWLSLHGAAYGLCQIYANESWHFELRPGAATEGCPELYPDPTYDPRLRA